MNNLDKKLDISSLPPNAQAELIDFFEFLSNKYSVSFDAYSEERNRTNRFETLLKNPIKVNRIQRLSRDEINER